MPSIVERTVRFTGIIFPAALPPLIMFNLNFSGNGIIFPDEGDSEEFREFQVSECRSALGSSDAMGEDMAIPAFFANIAR